MEQQLLAELAALKDRVALLEKAARKADVRLLSKAQAAKRLGIDRTTTLQFLIRSKQLTTVRVGKRVKIAASEVERLCTEGFTRPS